VHGRELLDTAAVLRYPKLNFAFVNWRSACEEESPRMALWYVVINVYNNFVYPVRCCDFAVAL